MVEIGAVRPASAARLRDLRLSRRLTQRQLADRAGISIEAVWTIENGRKSPRRGTLALLAAALGVPVADLAAAVGRRPRRSQAMRAPDGRGSGGCPHPLVGAAIVMAPQPS